MTSLPSAYGFLTFLRLGNTTPTKLYSSLTPPEAVHVTPTHQETDSLFYMCGTDSFPFLPNYKNDFLWSTLAAFLSVLPGAPAISCFSMNLMSNPAAHMLHCAVSFPFNTGKYSGHRV